MHFCTQYHQHTSFLDALAIDNKMQVTDGKMLLFFLLTQRHHGQEHLLPLFLQNCWGPFRNLWSAIVATMGLTLRQDHSMAATARSQENLGEYKILRKKKNPHQYASLCLNSSWIMYYVHGSIAKHAAGFCLSTGRKFSKCFVKETFTYKFVLSPLQLFLLETTKFCIF